MNKIIGLVTGYGVQDWIEPCLKQAIEYCDEVLISIGPKSPVMKRFEDNTFYVCQQYASKYSDKVKLFSVAPDTDATAIGTAVTLNILLQKSELFEPGNWIWILDSDEFYHRETYNHIKDLIHEDVATHITVSAKFFLVNMQHYLESYNQRLFKITDLNKKDESLSLFLPTQHWSMVPNKVEVTTHKKYSMFHYSMLKDPRMRIFQWGEEQPGRKQKHKSKWGNEIYKYYDLNNEEYWLDKNKEVSGIRHPLFHNAYKAADDGKLLVYNGKQPEYIEETDLPKVEDFRKFYNFV